MRTEQGLSPLTIFDALCRALSENYPMLEYAGWNESWAGEFRVKIEAAPTRAAAFEAMDQLVCRLNDYHTDFSWRIDRVALRRPSRFCPCNR